MKPGLYKVVATGSCIERLKMGAKSKEFPDWIGRTVRVIGPSLDCECCVIVTEFETVSGRYEPRGCRTPKTNLDPIEKEIAGV